MIKNIFLSKSHRQAQAGFTLIELLVVISIIGLLASVVLVSLNSARDKAKNARALADLRQLRAGIAMLENDTGKWPNGCPIEAVRNPEVFLDQASAGIKQKPAVGVKMRAVLSRAADAGINKNAC